MHVFAAHGYDAWGLEAAEDAVKAAGKFAGEIEGKAEYKAVNGQVGKGKTAFTFGDFYKDGWEETIGKGGFDVIYDYTVSQIIPSRCSILKRKLG